MKNADTFTHFPKNSVQFLVELSDNNDRDWFKQHQPRYEQEVREPARAFVREMLPRLRKFSKHLVGSDRKVGGSLMRPQRDTRFSPDKTPYKTNVGIHFRHEVGKDVHAPGVYLHFDPAEVFLGVGIWRPDAPALLSIRKRIADKPSQWRKARDQVLSAKYTLGGESLKRAPKGFDPEHPQLEDIKRKDFIAVVPLSHSVLFRKGFPDLLMERLAASKPYVRFLCQALELPL